MLTGLARRLASLLGVLAASDGLEAIQTQDGEVFLPWEL